MEALSVGDQVLYLPHAVHALECDPRGRYAWVVGLKRVEQKMQPGGGWTTQETVEELSDQRLSDFLDWVRRHPNPAEEKTKLVFLRPRQPWPATVTAVHEDGTLSLDIQSGTHGAVTLHCARVARDEARQQPHSCHCVRD